MSIACPPIFSKQDVVREFLNRFPKSPKQTIAKIIFKTHPLLFPTLDAARSAIRYAKGANGKKARAYIDPSAVSLGKAGTISIPPLPKGLRHFDKWGAQRLDTPGEEMRLLDLPDVHVPYHDERALSLALEFGDSYKPTHVLFSGDLADFFSVSKWEKDPRKRDLASELVTARNVIGHVRGRYPDAQLIMIEGNHENRWDRYLTLKAPELFGVPEFQLPAVLHLDEFGVRLVRDMQPLQIAQLYVVHGHEFRWAISNPVNPARGYYNKAKVCLIGHHLHQSSTHNEKGLDDVVISCWSTGCLCDLHPDYAPINKWNHGFATVDLSKDGMFEVHNYKLIQGRVFEA